MIKDAFSIDEVEAKIVCIEIQVIMDKNDTFQSKLRRNRQNSFGTHRKIDLERYDYQLEPYGFSSGSIDHK